MSRILLVLIVCLTIAGGAWLLLGLGGTGTVPSGPSIAATQRDTVAALNAAGRVKLQTDLQGQVVALRVTGKVDDEFTKLLAALTTLESLHLDRTEVSDAGIHGLSALRQLRELSVAGCAVSDTALETLGKLSSLRVLNLSGTDVTDQGLSHLARLDQLTHLYLSDTQITGAGLLALGPRLTLEVLNVNGTPADKATLQAVRQMPVLETLYLDQTPLDDSLTPELTEVITSSTPELRGLFLEGTSISDASIEALGTLSAMPQLSMVRLAQTKLSRAGFDELAASAPNIQFVFGGGASNDQ